MSNLSKRPASALPEKQRFALQELPHHLLQSRDLPKLGQLVRSEFLEVKAKAFGDAASLLDAGDIAKTLAQAGDCHWNDLVPCAYAYCGFAERAGGSAGPLETLIQDGNVALLLETIERELVEPARGRLMLAASVLLLEAGNTRAGEDLRTRALKIVRQSAYSQVCFACSCLVSALISENEDTSDGWMQYPKDAIGAPLDVLHAPLPILYRVPPRRTVPLRDTLRSSLATKDYDILGPLLGFWGWSLVGIILTAVYVLRDVGAKEWGLGMGVVWLFIAYYPALVVACLLRLGFAKVCSRVLQARLPRLGQILGGLGRAFVDAHRRERSSLAARAARFQGMLWRALGEHMWEEIPAGMVAEMVRGSGEPKQAAYWVRVATGMGDRACAAVAAELLGLSEGQRKALARELLVEPGLAKDAKNLFRVVTAALGRDLDPLSLHSYLARCGLKDRKRLVNELRTAVQPVCLAKALLAGLTSEWEKRFRRSMLTGIVTTTSQNLRRLRIACNRTIAQPIAVLEPLWWVILYAPATLFALTGIVIGLAMPAVIGLLGLPDILSCGFDPFGLTRLPCDIEPAERVRLIKEAIQKPLGAGFYSTGQAARIASALLAAHVVQTGCVGRGAYDPYLANFIGPVLPRLIRQGVVWDRLSAVLKTMGDRKFLDAAISAGQMVRPNRAIRRPRKECHERQILSTLPLPLWESLGLTAVLSLLGSLLWLATLVAVGPQEILTYLQAYGGWPVPVFCIFLVIVQHVFRKGIPLILTTVLAFVGLPALFSLVARSAGLTVAIWTLDIVLVCFFLTNVLIPEFIAHWRGANLLYPTARQLRAQRITWLFLVITTSVMLAVLPTISPWLLLIAIPWATLVIIS